MPRAALTDEQFAFVACLVCVFVDVMGQQFLSPVIVPYAQSLQASLSETGALLTAGFAATLLSQFLMSWLADTRGRRLVICISMAGSALAYLVQGLAPLGCGTGDLFYVSPVAAETSNGTSVITDTGCGNGWEVLLLGRVLGGLFSGTFSTVLAYLVELSMPDMDVLKQRQTWVFSVRTIIPIAMGSIGGAIATFGLFIPFLTSSAAAFLGFIFVFMTLREATDIKADQRRRLRPQHQDARAIETSASFSNDDASTRDEESPSRAPSKEADDAKDSDPMNSPKRDHSVWLDKVLLLIAFGFLFFGVAITGVIILFPLHLSRPRFGLPGSGGEPGNAAGLIDEKVLSGEVSKTVGLLNIPVGLMQVLSMNVLYMWLSRRLGRNGNIICLVIGGMCILPCILLVGLTTKLWQVAVANGMTGVCAGLFMGGLMNLPNSYTTRVFPHKIARARVVYLTAMFFGNIVGPMIIVSVWEATDGGLAAWGIVGAGYATASLFCFLAGLLIRKRLSPYDSGWGKKYTELSPRQQDLAHRTGALAVDEYFESLFADIRRLAESAHDENRLFLFSGRIQMVLRQRLLRAIPEYPRWDTNAPAPHLRALAQDLAALDADKQLIELADAHQMPELLKASRRRQRVDHHFGFTHTVEDGFTEASGGGNSELLSLKSGDTARGRVRSGTALSSLDGLELVSREVVRL